jgi:organic radical activating enzyme
MYEIDRLDFNIAYACNLSCKGCISLSNFDRTGVESFASIEKQINTWSKIINPKVLTLFGGEPLLHPRLHNVIKTIRSAWNHTTIRLITNGYFLKNYEPQSWFNYKPFEIQVSIHRKDHEKILTNEIKKILEQEKNWKVKRNIGKSHRDITFSIKDFSIWKSRFKDFVTPYKIDKGTLLPFKSDPKKAHKICGSPDTPVLYKNKLYKCPPIANILDMTHRKGYSYSPYDNNDNLENFINNIGKPESICSMCPESLKHKFDHYLKQNVHVKNIN